MIDATAAPRLTESSLRLALAAAGGPTVALGKARRLAAILRAYADAPALDARLARMAALGLAERAPTRAQLFAGSVDMVRFFIVPAADDYYRRRGISFQFHQLLRFLDEPASLADPVGLFSTRDGIIGHLMQVVHANPVYDLQLLSTLDDGLDQLEAQLESMLAGTHPRARSIGAIVEEPDYHRKLLAFVRAWRRDPSTPPLLRVNVAEDAELRARDRTFGSLPAAMRYFGRLPPDWPAALRHVRTTRHFPALLAEPEPGSP